MIADAMCLALGCACLTDGSLPMCRRHWDMLPSTLRAPLLHAFDREANAGFHVAAIRRAITAVAEHEGTMTPEQVRESRAQADRWEQLDAPEGTHHRR